MKTLERAVGNVSILMVSQLITWTATIFVTAALARHLGDVQFGELYLAMSFAIIFGVLVEFGLDQQLVREVARDRRLASTYLMNSIVMKVVLAAVAYGIIFVAVRVLNYSADLQLTIGIYSLILVFNGLSGSFAAVYQASENVLFSALGTIIEKCVVCVLAVVLLNQGAGIVEMAIIFVTAAALGATFKGCFLLDRIQVRGVVSIQRMRSLAINGVPFLLFWALGSVYYRIDVVMLSKMSEPAVVGWYGAAYRLFDTLVFLPSIVSAAVMYPILARLAVQSRDDLRIAVQKGIDVMLILGIPICTGLFVLADPIIQLVYGKPEFLNAVGALQFLSLALFFLYVNSVLAVALVSLNRETRMTIVAALATVINLSLNWLLIPHFQHLAAAAVTAITEGFILCYLLWQIPSDLLSRSSVLVLGKALVSVTVMSLTMYLLRGESLLVIVPAGGLAYCLSGLALRVVPANDVRMFREMLAARFGRRLKVSET
jgi:O-antigen/teichoic acid export membrane protein